MSLKDTLEKLEKTDVKEIKSQDELVKDYSTLPGLSKYFDMTQDDSQKRTLSQLIENEYAYLNKLPDYMLSDVYKAYNVENIPELLDLLCKDYIGLSKIIKVIACENSRDSLTINNNSYRPAYRPYPIPKGLAGLAENFRNSLSIETKFDKDPYLFLFVPYTLRPRTIAYPGITPAAYCELTVL